VRSHQRPPSGIIVGLGGAVTVALSGYLYDAYLSEVLVFFLLIAIGRFFGDGGYAASGPYSAEVWPAGLRASGMGFGYGVGDLGKVIGPLGLALIVGSSNFVSPKVALAALDPAFVSLTFWSALSAFAFWYFGFETEGRSIKEIDSTLAAEARRAPAKAPAV
jgi:MFS transporter, putative metabolite:H+ symporter